MYVYIQTESALWTVGFYDPTGKWHAESDNSTPELAADRVAYLNGSKNDKNHPGHRVWDVDEEVSGK